jgi:flagellar biosynthesis/type III secretory pathway M-ring protein FliF/YscJ
MLFAFGGAVFALGVFGAVRTLRKRRRRLLEQEQADAASEIEAMHAAKGNS